MRNLLMFVLLALVALAAAAESSPEPPWNNPINCSGTISVTNTAQAMITTTGARHGYQIQNLSSDTLAFSEFTSTPTSTTAGAWILAPSGGSYNTPSTYASGATVFINGPTAGDAFTCESW